MSLLSDKQERDWAACSKRSRTLMVKLGRKRELQAPLDHIREQNLVRVLRKAEKELRATWLHCAEYARTPPTTMDILWGADDVLVGRLRAGKQLVMATRDIFTPAPLHALAKWPALATHPSYPELRNVFFASSLVIARSAVEALVHHAAFGALATARPFTVTASPRFEGMRLVLARVL